MLMTRRVGLMTAGAAAVLALATACGSSGSSGAGGSSAMPSTGASATPAPPSSAASTPQSPGASNGLVDLKVVSSSTLGQIVTDGHGNTLYRFDEDTAKPSMSNCTGSCAGVWPAAPAPSGAITASGVSANLVGTVTRADGTKQLTLNGWPLYRYSGDKAPGDINGEGIGGTWFAATPTGGKAMPMVQSTPSTPSSTPSSGAYGY